MTINPKPVYEEDQVLTYHNLMVIRTGYLYQYLYTKWYQPIKRIKFWIAIGTLDALLDYLESGKKGR